MISGYPKSIGIPRADGLSTGPPSFRASCHAPDPGLTRLASPNRSPGRETIYILSILGLSLTYSFSELYLYL